MEPGPLTAAAPLCRDEFAAALRGLAPRYWDRHPFHLRLHAGLCTPGEVRSWVANRWYYQRILARKNAAIMANCPLPEVRRHWLERIVFHDGTVGGEDVQAEPDARGGAVAAGPGARGEGFQADGASADWLVLADAVGLPREELLDERHVLRGTRFAVDGYLHFCQTRPWTEAVAAALTEMFAPELMAARVAAWRRHYDWIKPDGYAYFEKRIPIVRDDVRYTLELVLTHCTNADQQRAALAALAFKCDVLGAMLDAIDYAGPIP